MFEEFRHNIYRKEEKNNQSGYNTDVNQRNQEEKDREEWEHFFLRNGTFHRKLEEFIRKIEEDRGARAKDPNTKNLHFDNHKIVT